MSAFVHEPWHLGQPWIKGEAAQQLSAGREMQPWVAPVAAIEGMTTYKYHYRPPGVQHAHGARTSPWRTNKQAPTPLHYQRSSEDYGSDGFMGRQRPSTSKWLAVHRGSQDWRGYAPGSGVALQRWWHAEPRVAQPSQRRKAGSQGVAAGMASLDQSCFGYNPPASTRVDASSFMHQPPRTGGFAYERSSDAVMGRRPASAAARQADLTAHDRPAGMASRPSDRARGARFE